MIDSFKDTNNQTFFLSMPSITSETKVLPKKRTTTKKVKETRRLPKLIPKFNVVLLDDNDHTYDYVVEMLMKLFGHSQAKAFRMACMVDFTGRVIVDTTSKERAELKRDQIHAYGADWRIPRCVGSMSAVIEPAE